MPTFLALLGNLALQYVHLCLPLLLHVCVLPRLNAPQHHEEDDAQHENASAHAEPDDDGHGEHLGLLVLKVAHQLAVVTTHLYLGREDRAQSRYS